MMRIVIDASAVIAVILNEPTKSAIIEATKGAEAISPASLPWEVGNALSANFKRDRITLNQALRAAEEYQKINVRLVDVDLEHALRISMELKIYAYDASLLWCASFYKIPLLCLDKPMVKMAQAIGIKTIEVKFDG
jgi:predicted nucleic acid-binding protein